MIKRYHADIYEGDASVYISDAPCFNPDCRLGSQEHVDVFTDGELRAYAERIIQAALDFCCWHDQRIVRSARNYHYDAIIAAAEADQ